MRRCDLALRCCNVLIRLEGLRSRGRKAERNDQTILRRHASGCSVPGNRTLYPFRIRVPAEKAVGKGWAAMFCHAPHCSFIPSLQYEMGLVWVGLHRRRFHVVSSLVLPRRPVSGSSKGQAPWLPHPRASFAQVKSCGSADQDFCFFQEDDKIASQRLVSVRCWVSATPADLSSIQRSNGSTRQKRASRSWRSSSIAV